MYDRLFPLKPVRLWLQLGSIYGGFVLLLLPGLVPLISLAQIKPIALHPVNPHYFIYKNKPTILEPVFCLKNQLRFLALMPTSETSVSMSF